MRYAIIENDTVVNIVVSETAREANWVDAANAKVGDNYDGSTFTTSQSVIDAQQEAVRQSRIQNATEKAQDIVLKDQISQKIEELPDEDKDVLVYLFDPWSGNSVSYVIGDVVEYNGIPYRVVQAHTSQSTFTPDVVPALFTPLRNTTDAPEPWVQPTGAQDAYAINDKVTHDNPNDSGNIWVYESAIDSNTTEPGRDSTFDRYWTPIEAV